MKSQVWIDRQAEGETVEVEGLTLVITADVNLTTVIDTRVTLTVAQATQLVGEMMDRLGMTST